jgi:cytochrome c oxidase cbb3-type subunit 3
MSDFTSGFWNIYITVLAVLGIAGCALLLWLQSRRKITAANAHGDAADAAHAGTTGHIWDEDLMELNTPMPAWWMWMFYITIVFGIAYLFLYPGLGSYEGKLGWKSSGAYTEELAKADAEYGPLFDKYLKQDLKAVAADPQAHAMGERLFLTYCSQCHGSDARGGKGFPNLTGTVFLFGRDPETIETTITNGRNGQMPPMAAALGSEQDVENVANYVLSLTGGTADPAKAELGKAKFVNCAPCHGAEGNGNPVLGAPALANKERKWLFGGSKETIAETIQKGRSSTMPTFKNFLGEAKIHVLAAYVWSLSNGKSDQAQN